MRSLVLLLLVGACFALEDDKIFEGYECTPNSQPWQVSVDSLGYHFCGGSLINQNWVLSAAHCYQSHLEVRLGEHNIETYEGTEQLIFSSHIIRHPNYDYWNIDNDIMLIKLSQPATLNSYVQPVALPKSCPPAGTWCTVSGWGLRPNEAGEHNLHCAKVPTISDSDCNKSYPGLITNSMLCAGFMKGFKEICEIDYGGPLVCNGELQGVVSWSTSCSQKTRPGVYTKVCLFTSWISQTMASN